MTSATINIVRSSANNESSNGLNSLFNFNLNNNVRSIYQNKIINTFSSKRKCKSLHETGTRLYNALPPQIRDKKSSHYTFKKAIKLHILELFHLKKH